MSTQIVEGPYVKYIINPLIDSFQINSQKDNCVSSFKIKWPYISWLGYLSVNLDNCGLCMCKLKGQGLMQTPGFHNPGDQIVINKQTVRETNIYNTTILLHKQNIWKYCRSSKYSFPIHGFKKINIMCKKNREFKMLTNFVWRKDKQINHCYELMLWKMVLRRRDHMFIK